MVSVVTGASGHLGSNLIRQLAPGEEVRAMVHTNRAPLHGLPVSSVTADVLDPQSLRRAFRGADTVYHLAAIISITGDPCGLVAATNIAGTRNAAQAALDEGVSRFIHVSSVHAFALSKARGAIDERHPKVARGAAYDHSKASGEAEVEKARRAGLDATIVNPTGIMGPFDFAPSRMGQLLLDLANRRLPALVTGGFDFVDARDVARTIIAARDHAVAGRQYLISGHFLTVRELADLAEAATGVPAPKRTVANLAALLGVPFAAARARMRGIEPKFTRESLAALRHGPRIDSAQAKRDLGHRSRDPLATVQDSYAWFASRGQWAPP